MQPTRRSRLGPFLFLLAVLVGGAIAWTQRWALYDWRRLQSYTPSAAISELASATTMNDDSRRMFYAQHPQLDDRSTFRAHCNEFGEITIVLGCFVPRTGIYIFDVNDPRLAGVKEVTAAHELLHAAYERLSSSERQRVDQLTQQAYDNLKDDRVRATVAGYQKRDSSVVPNELHSIIGTEVRDLSPELEEYYRRYFNDRKKVVAFAMEYEGAITELRDKAEAIRLELEGLKQEIEQQQDTLTSDREQLQRDRNNANTQAEVDAFNRRVNAYNTNIRELNTMINQYNALVDEYQSVAVEAQEIYKALDSRPTL